MMLVGSDALPRTQPQNVESDERLMGHFCQGSEDAFGELFRRYREPIYGFFRRRIGHAARAEDLAQETFLAVLKGAARYEPRALFRTYLYGIALKLLAAERRRAAHAAVDGPRAEAALDGPPDGISTQPDRETSLWIRAAVAQLEPWEREVLLLREYEELSYAEIAALMRVPVNTVRSRLFRARMALRRQLASGRDLAGRKP
jgi:RNA polymerase sigma-70 factor (ECF subfamily)